MEQNQELENYINSTKKNVKDTPDPERAEFMKKMFADIPKYEGEYTPSTHNTVIETGEAGMKLLQEVFEEDMKKTMFKEDPMMKSIRTEIEKMYPDHDPTAVDSRGNPLPLGVTRVGDSYRIDAGGTVVHTGQGGLDLYKEALNTEYEKIAMCPSSWDPSMIDLGKTFTNSQWFAPQAKASKSNKGKYPSNRIPPKKRRKK